MEFFIKQNSNEPKLKLQLIDDGLTDKENFFELLENSIITIDIFNQVTNEYLVLSGNCTLGISKRKFNDIHEEYYIIYSFNDDDTKVKGRFEAIITIQFRDTNLNPTNKLIIPIKEKLFINVI